MRIFTKRLELTNFKSEYVEVFTKALSDPRVFLYLPERVPTIGDVDGGAKRYQLFFSHRRNARLGVSLVLIAQLLVLPIGIAKTFPGVADIFAQTTFQAPTLLKLAIEVAVFYIGMTLKATGILALLLMPTWAGLISFMAHRSREGYYVEVTPAGVAVGSPVDRFFL